MKLSDELKRCLDGSGCGNCEYHEADTKFTCKGLLEKAYERIKGYEELKGQGLLLKLPCKVGNTVYIIDDIENEFEMVSVVTSIEIDDKNEIYIMISDGFQSGSSSSFGIDDFGKTVFLTREQAESELKKNKEMEERKWRG